jgi:hypothetical protein
MHDNLDRVIQSYNEGRGGSLEDSALEGEASSGQGTSSIAKVSSNLVMEKLMMSLCVCVCVCVSDSGGSQYTSRQSDVDRLQSQTAAKGSDGDVAEYGQYSGRHGVWVLLRQAVDRQHYFSTSAGCCWSSK